MKTLALTDERLEIIPERVPGALSLRTWLAGRWAILFSHPEDFAQEQLEMDRWLSVVSERFRAHGIAPVALRRGDGVGDTSWLGRLAASCQDCAASLSLEQLKWATLADFATSALRAEIIRNGPRFAMIIDSELRCRRALRYRQPIGLPSPLELTGWAVALRKRDQHAHEAGDFLPISKDWASAAHCHTGHAARG